MPRVIPNFWDKVDKDGPVPAHRPELGPCWPWTGPTVRRGHGRFGKKVASRHSWELANGPIPDGLWVLHQCDNPPCVNPAHLYLGTAADNVRDAMERGQYYRPPRKNVCGAGHAKKGDNLMIVVSGGRTLHRCRKCENERSAVRQREARRARGLMKTRLTAGDKERIIELRRDGLSHRKIARDVGRSLMAVQRVIGEAGL